MTYKKIVALMLALSCQHGGALAAESASSPFLQITAVPRPVTYSITLLGLVVIGLTRRRRQPDRWS